MKEIKTIKDMCEVSPVCFETHYQYLITAYDKYHDVCTTFQSISEMIEQEKNVLLSILNVYHYDFKKIDKSTFDMLHHEILSLATKIKSDWVNEWREQRSRA